jgi:predicted homoserine dehydrogenase-like protein
MPAAESRRVGALPIGLARGVRLTRPVDEDRPVTWDDVAVDEGDEAVTVRRQMEREFGQS